MKTLYDLEDIVFDAGDRVSAFLYDQWGWHLRIIVMWTYTIFTAPVVNMLIAGDLIDTWGEWFSVGVVAVMGMTALWLMQRGSVSVVNAYMAILRRGPFMMFLRMLGIAFSITYLVGMFLSPSPEHTSRAVHEIHYLVCLYMAITQVPDRPRRKRRLLPRLKLFEDPLPQGVS